jgi:hypothetical protein
LSGAKSGAFFGDSGLEDADLAKLVEAWPGLDQQTRRTILDLAELG